MPDARVFLETAIGQAVGQMDGGGLIAVIAVILDQVFCHQQGVRKSMHSGPQARFPGIIAGILVCFISSIAGIQGQDQQKSY
ncbi:MAG TPA: hypothetical protein DCQ34_01370 [Chitinophagaceae bacterium]|nr:hypothetical protein [Chitinophagaceae bacterium]